MPAVKLNISLDEPVARTLRRRAVEAGKSTSRYLADLVLEDAQRHQDELAAEGYRVLSSDTADFAAAAWPVGQETWPEWVEEAGEPETQTR
jgi:hypothetical protein